MCTCRCIFRTLLSTDWHEITHLTSPVGNKKTINGVKIISSCYLLILTKQVHYGTLIYLFVCVFLSHITPPLHINILLKLVSLSSAFFPLWLLYWFAFAFMCLQAVLMFLLHQPTVVQVYVYQVSFSLKMKPI